MAEHGMPGDDHEVAHPFFTFMDMPEARGVYSDRLGALVKTWKAKKTGDFALDLETRPIHTIGVHLRNEAIVQGQHGEFMFLSAAAGGVNGMDGFVSLIEYELFHAFCIHAFCC